MPASFAALFLVALLGAALSNAVPVALFAFYTAASAITFIAYARDKSAARNNAWRTRESTLHAFSLAGGWPGALIAQEMLRHKSKKTPFRIWVWVTVIINCSALSAYLFPQLFFAAV